MVLATASRDISLFLAVLSISALGCGAQEQYHTKPRDASHSEPGSWSLHDLVTADTVQTILADKHLRKTYRAVVSVCVDTSRSLADQLEVPELSTISDSLDSHLRQFNSQADDTSRLHLRKRRSRTDASSKTKRAGLLSKLLPGGGKGNDNDAAAGGQAQGNDTADAGGGGILGGLLSGGGGGKDGPIGGIISQAASGLIGRVINMTGPAVAGAGFFGGVGAGEGAAQGLNLASANTSMDTGATVAQENGMKSSGLNSAIESATMGLTATALRALRQGNALQLPDLGPVAEALGGGLGNGAAAGLKLTTDNRGAPGNGSGLDGFASSFAFGLSKSLTESANTSNLFGQMGGQNGTGMTNMLLKLAGPAASGLGKGLGSGAAVGLGLQPDDGPAATAKTTAADGSVDVSGIAQDFASGLTSRFLANGTATNAIKGLTSGGGGGGGGVGANLDVGRIANGLARGLLAGAGDGAEALGGVNAIISGKAKLQTTPAPDTQVTFNDSVGGAATGFGQGLGNSAVITAQKLLSRGADMSDGAAKSKRSTSSAVSSHPASRVAARQISNGINVNISSVLSAAAISSVIQKVVDVLTCEGVGGLALVAQGLSQSGTISAGGFDPSTTNFIKDLIPQGLISFTKDGNTYDIDGKQLSKALDGSLSEAANGLSINGFGFSRFVGILIAHIFFAVVVFAVLLPLVLTFDSSRNILLLLQVEHVLPAWTLKATKIIWIAGIAPSLIIILVLGVVPGPRGAHFRTAHGVLGLITLLVTVAAVSLYILSTRGTPLASIKKIPIPVISQGCNQLLLVLTLPTLTTGFSDLSLITLCLTRVVPLELAVSLGLALGSVLVLAQAITGLELFLQWRAGKRKSRAGQSQGSLDPEMKRDLSK
ncbi:hypothetical protein HRG_005422 [Hirsutella rhossiliensis]|uniref:Uncharacterized protein n=1 Tax=Hirsutella rhossiliensis TaxID=111463 RepID=A0A9P8MX07_9HYPO|nr:uncharacterized protein HRG_05422 [Hirsutella rhossiliensis]KAH0962912.1 hypothetical protein HRG_05422 [Hirsutella rhossiliensis]